MAAVTQHKGSLPHGWKVLLSKSYPDRVYYFNEHTGVSTWDCPELLHPEASKSSTYKVFKERSASPPKLPSVINGTRDRSEVMPNNPKSDCNKQRRLLNVPDDIQVSVVASSKSSITSIKHSKTAIVCPVGYNNKAIVRPPIRFQLSNKIRVPSVSSSSSGPIKANNYDHKFVEVKKTESNSVESQSGRKLEKINLKRCRSPDSEEEPQVSKKLSDRSKSVNSIKVTKNMSDINARKKQCKVGKIQCLSKHAAKQYPSATSILNKTCPIKMQFRASKKSTVLASKAPNSKLSSSYNEKMPQENKIIKSKRRNSDDASLVRLSTEKSPEESSHSDVEMFDMTADLATSAILNDSMEIENSTDLESFVIIVDTNILMKDLNMIDELKDTPFQGCGPPHLFIPWVVLKELDGLKRTNEKAKQTKAIEAVRYVYSMLNTKHPRFHGQTAMSAKRITSGLDECNDDKVLGCCLQFCEIMPREKVILLTNDKNLCNKALVHDVVVYTIDAFLKNMKPDVELIREKDLSSDSNCYTRNGNEPEKKLKMEVDSVICKTKMLLKSILEPILEKVLQDAYGDVWKKIVLEPPWSLFDILQMYGKYWSTVFAFVLPQGLQCHFVELRCLFKISKGFFCNADDALKALAAIEVICGQLLNIFPSIEPAVKRITRLSKECKFLCKRGEENIVDENRRKNSVGSNNVISVFSHIWDLMNHLCGMIMDFCKVPHNFTYQKPAQVPAKVAFSLLIANLYPNVNQMKKAMTGVLDLMIKSTEKDKHITTLYNFLVQFVPSLQIQAMPPPLENFNIANLKSFCLDENNREMLQNGFVQLLEFHSKLNECIHNWKN